MAVLLSASKNPKLLRRLLFAISIFMDLRTLGFLLISLREAWSPQTGIANGVARPCRKVAQKWFRTLESLEPPNQDHWLKSVGQTMWNCFTLSTKYLNYRKKLQNVHFPTDIHVCIYTYTVNYDSWSCSAPARALALPQVEHLVLTVWPFGALRIWTMYWLEWAWRMVYVQ